MLTVTQEGVPSFAEAGGLGSVPGGGWRVPERPLTSQAAVGWAGGGSSDLALRLGSTLWSRPRIPSCARGGWRR